jgi:hypothetical protein
MWLLTLTLMQVAPPPSVVRASGVLQRPGLVESSGVAVSRAHRGILWTHNDSGDGPFIYATDTAGADFGKLRVTGADAEDWEDITLGPCPRSRGQCLYLADTGDNGERRLSVTVYAVPEPAPPSGPGDSLRATAPAAALRLTYPGGPADVEAVYVTRDGSLYFVTKGRSRGVRLYRVPKTAWDSSGVTTAELVQDLPITPEQRIGRWVTGAAASPDGARVVVRTYSELYLFTPTAHGALAPNPIICWLGALEAQGEGVDFLDATTLVLTSEAPRGVTGMIHIVRCP